MTITHFLTAILIAFLFIFLFGIGWNTFYFYTHPEYSGWPAVTRCRICDKRVWEWQSYERRAMTVSVNKKEPQLTAIDTTQRGIILGTFVSASGIVHKNCKGHGVMEMEIK